jgi:hypothetical protein
VESVIEDRWRRTLVTPESDLVSIFLKVESLKREETAGQASEPAHSFRRFTLIGTAEIS